MKILKEHFGFEEKLNYVFLENSKGKVYIISTDLANLELSNLRIDSLGLYFGKLEKDGLRLSIEGSQIIGPKAKKNVLEIKKGTRDIWIKGYDTEIQGNPGFVIIKHKDDFMGCGKLNNNKLYNYVPKNRRLVVIND